MTVAFVSGAAATGEVSRPAEARRRGDGFGEMLAATAASSDVSGAGRAAATGSSTSRSWALDTPLLPPTRETVEMLASELAASLKDKFAKAGLAENPPVTLRVDDTGGIHATGDRDDLAAVEGLIASDPALQLTIRNTNAIASQTRASNAERTLAFQQAYRASSNPAAVVAQFADVFASPAHVAMSLVFGGGAVSVGADGATWIAGRGA
ncbi:hypothetical protein [Rhodoplanes roseus]|uniref:Uncharacterized protein n=1 Tax=Rhodoplanes roseus TaxID=29409 RepID=A0A327KL26_9BRAD|nr:hypothetical protein [Rhodoplanes roseus]RAI39207.1 hypothetical protein CH341_26315 [Rhodoplanes roseus]